MTITIDTNIFIEMLLGQEKAEESRSLLDAVAGGQINAVISHFSLHGIEATIRSQKKLAEFLKDVDSSRGLKIFDTSLQEEQTIAALADKMGLDFDDAVQFYVATRTGSSAIASFDRHLDRLEIPRREPSQILDEIKEIPPKTSRKKPQN